MVADRDDRNLKNQEVIEHFPAHHARLVDDDEIVIPVESSSFGVPEDLFSFFVDDGPVDETVDGADECRATGPFEERNHRIAVWITPSILSIETDVTQLAGNCGASRDEFTMEDRHGASGRADERFGPLERCCEDRNDRTLTASGETADRKEPAVASAMSANEVHHGAVDFALVGGEIGQGEMLAHVNASARICSILLRMANVIGDPSAF
jgi:hypothetical protein